MFGDDFLGVLNRISIRIGTALSLPAHRHPQPLGPEPNTAKVVHRGAGVRSPRPVLEPFAGPSRFATSDQRVVEGQRMMRSASDVFLGFRVEQGLDGRPHDYYVRQLWDAKVIARIEGM